MRKLLVVALLGTAYFLSNCINTNYVVEEKYHVVKTGQTLWQIADRYMPEQEKTEDIREFIFEITKANDIKGNEYLMPGDCLVIPLHKVAKK